MFNGFHYFNMSAGSFAYSVISILFSSFWSSGIDVLRSQGLSAYLCLMMKRSEIFKVSAWKMVDS